MSRRKSVYLLRLPAGLLLLALCVLMAGCAVYDTITEADLSEEYRVVLARWTSEARVYKDFASILQVSATFKSVPFRQAYVRKYARDYQLTPAEAKEMLVFSRQPVSSGEYNSPLDGGAVDGYNEMSEETDLHVLQVVKA